MESILNKRKQAFNKRLISVNKLKGGVKKYTRRMNKSMRILVMNRDFTT